MAKVLIYLGRPVEVRVLRRWGRWIVHRSIGWGGGYAISDSVSGFKVVSVPTFDDALAFEEKLRPIQDSTDPRRHVRDLARALGRKPLILDRFHREEWTAFCAALKEPINPPPARAKKIRGGTYWLLRGQVWRLDILPNGRIRESGRETGEPLIRDVGGSVGRVVSARRAYLDGSMGICLRESEWLELSRLSVAKELDLLAAFDQLMLSADFSE